MEDAAGPSGASSRPPFRPPRTGSAWLYAFIPTALIIGLAIGVVVGFVVTGNGNGTPRDVAHTLQSASTTGRSGTTSASPSTPFDSTAFPTAGGGATDHSTITTTPPATLTTFPRSTTTAAVPEIARWPDRDAWTVVVHMGNPDSGGRIEELEQVARKLLSDGFPAGIMSAADHRILTLSEEDASLSLIRVTSWSSPGCSIPPSKPPGTVSYFALAGIPVRYSGATTSCQTSSS